MHSMSDSAILTTREVRRRETANRISHCARALTDQRGLDGFTMDELAEIAGVSRRTLFNYFPGKDAAVLGPEARIDDAHAEEFIAGGPHGHLVDDLTILVAGLFSLEGISADEISLVRKVMHDNPRLLALAMKRFEGTTERLLTLIEAREGAAYDEDRARVVIQVMAALFDLTLTTYAAQPGAELGELYAAAVRTARSVFA